MLEKIYEFVKEYDMLSEGDTVVCGLSGGADSVCLLMSMKELSSRFSVNVEALHVNHCLRGQESDRDENFCRLLCERLGVPFKAVSCDVRKFSEENSLSDEEAARTLRYRIFAENSRGKKLATAHNAGDNLETVLFNLTRGTALKGLAGIPPVRDNIIRPLLAVSRQEIENFLESIGQDWVTDSTNLSNDYTRNKLRHQVIPLLRQINNSVIETSVRTIGGLREENRFIEEETDRAEKICRCGNTFKGLADFPKVVRKRCISRLLSENNLPYSHSRLNEADGILINGGKINVSGNIYLCSENNSISLKTIVPTEENLISRELAIGENQIFSGKILCCEVVECDGLLKNNFVNKNLTFYALDYDKIKGSAVVRSRKYGDRIQLKGRNFTSSIKKLINETVPAEKRSTLHFIEDSEGTIFAEAVGVAQRVAPDKSTKRLLKITVKKERTE